MRPKRSLQRQAVSALERDGSRLCVFKIKKGSPLTFAPSAKASGIQSCGVWRSGRANPIVHVTPSSAWIEQRRQHEMVGGVLRYVCNDDRKALWKIYRWI